MALNQRKVAMVGCGSAGAASCFALMQSGLFSEMVLIDADQGKADGEAMDLAQGLTFARPMKIYAGTYEDLKDAAIVIVTASAPIRKGDTRLELVKKNKLYRSKGYYKPMFEVLDAPSSHFSVTFIEPYGSIDGSGDMPDFVWKGLSEIHQYLKSIVGDRKAEGHVDRIYGAEGIAGMHWTDGVVTVTTPEDSEMPLKRAARGVGDDNDSQLREMGFSHYHDGDQHYFLIHDNQLDKCRLFYSFDGNESTREQMVKHDMETMRNGIHTDSIGRTVWPVVNERFLSHPMIDALTTEQLEEMLNSIKERRYSPNGGLVWYTDIGQVNREMLSNEIKSRKKDTEH